MKIGIYGGTFNPIHLGHVHILKEFVKRLLLSKVIIVPTGRPPHKSAPELASDEDRYNMCRLAVGEIEYTDVEVSTMEMVRPGKSYSFETLTELKKQYPNDELYFLMGEDMFLTLDKWKSPDIICKCAAVCASPRSEDGLNKLIEQKKRLEEKLSARCVVEDISYLPVSSTEIRERIRRNESIKGLVPEIVEAYIVSRELYK